MSHSLQAPLHRATASTFEDLAFLFAEPDDAADANGVDATAAADATAAVSVGFRGAMRGRLVLVVPAPILPTIAANMLGEEGGALPLDVQRDALGELANVVCGNLLPEIDESGDAFDLDAPMAIEAGDAGTARAGERAVAGASLTVEGGRVVMRLFLEEAA